MPIEKYFLSNLLEHIPILPAKFIHKFKPILGGT